MQPSDKSSEAPAVTVEGERFDSDPRQINYPFADIPAPGGYMTVAPGILWLRIPMPMDLNHINLWLLDDDDGWTLVDSGIQAAIAKDAWEKLASELFARRPLKRIFLTHWHPDHIGLAEWLRRRYDVPVWMSERGHTMVRQFGKDQRDEDIARGHAFMRSHGFTDSDMLAQYFSGKAFRAGISGIPEVTKHPNDGDDIAVGASRWRVYETNGHAEGHQCLFDAQRDVLISGDQVLPTISPNVSHTPHGTDANPLASYIASLERLAELDNRTLVLPAHGKPFYGLRQRATALIEHHRGHLAALHAACDTPKTAYELAPFMFKRRLVGSHWLFAMGEIVAHTEYLAAAAQLTRQHDADGTIRYLRT